MNNDEIEFDENLEEPKKKSRRTRRDGPVPAGGVGSRPLVAIIGRPNVGKSTLFNRLVGKKLAIVEDIEGVTRDRHYADTNILGQEVVLIDTGGFDPESEDPMRESIARHVKLALAECDVVVCVLDGTREAQTADREAVQLLRAAKKPVIYCANKADSRGAAHVAMDLYTLGIPALIPVSALHGNGLGPLEDAISKALPQNEHATHPDLEDVPRVAIVGKPNAGKSSLVNRLIKEDRQTVDHRPGTTVDSVDALYDDGKRKLVIIDTAGIRRKSSVHESVESMSVYQAIRAIERSEVVLLLVDGQLGVAEQDAKIAGLAEERGRALVIGLNKVDLLRKDELRVAEQKVRDVLSFAPWTTIVPLSAQKGRGVDKLLDTLTQTLTAYSKRVPTAELNRFFDEVLAHHPPPLNKGKPVRLYYVTQASTMPPTFVAVTNFPDAVHFSYRRYVINAIRERFGFHGTPVRVLYRAKKRQQ